MDAEKYIARQNTAYAGPVGTWAERWIPFVCKHETVRCTHGDEIIGRRMRRRVCMICGRALRGDLPGVLLVHRQAPPIGRRAVTRLEVGISCDSPELAAELAAVDALPEPEKTAVMGRLLIAVGTMWVAKAARSEGRTAAFAHNRRSTTTRRDASDD